MSPPLVGANVKKRTPYALGAIRGSLDGANASS